MTAAKRHYDIAPVDPAITVVGSDVTSDRDVTTTVEFSADFVFASAVDD
jgi:hypothetical protein